MTDDYGFGEIETVKRGQAPLRAPTAAGRAQLLLVGSDQAERFDLPESGEVLIGRAPECEIRIDEPSLSRRHARLHMGPPITLEDLGSANGTTIRDVALSAGRPVEIVPGDAVDLGALTLYVQVPKKTTARLRRVLPHGYFEARLEAECARSDRLRSILAVGFVSVAPGTDEGAVREVLAETLRADEAAALYAPDLYEFLMVDTTSDDAERRAEAIVDRIHRIPGAAPRLGLALCPQDARSPEALIQRASEEARGARSGGGVPNVVVAAPKMRALHQLLDKIAQGRISVVVLGETGVGKEVTAAAVHERSPRARAPFVKLNCAALSDTLIESELFGYEKGAFTGAVKAKPGLLESAEGGTVFLDEVGELPMTTQVKLLRVLEERMVRRVGSLEPTAIDVRIVSATNRDLEAEIEAGRFRQDLYFRLNGIAVTVPPLRERPEEVSVLARLFVNQVCEQDRRPQVPAISPDALALLVEYRWPGNIRELKNVMERAVLLAGGEDIRPEHLPLEIMQTTVAPVVDASGPVAVPDVGGFDVGPGDAPGAAGTLLNDMQSFERQRIVDALEACGGNQTQAAKRLGIARRTLIKRLDLYGIERPRKGRRPT